MLSTNLKKKILLIVVATTGVGGITLISNLDLSPLLTVYGLLFTCQLGFLLFFLYRIRLSNQAKAKN